MSVLLILLILHQFASRCWSQTQVKSDFPVYASRQELKAFDSSAFQPDTFGYGAKISPDGQTMLVSAVGKGNAHGAVYVLSSTKYNAAKWSANTTLDATTVRFYQGVKSLNGGNVSKANSWKVWTQQALLVAADTVDFYNFGTDVAISANVIIVGDAKVTSGYSGNVGAAYIFNSMPSSTGDGGATWTQQTKLVASDAKKNNGFGNAVGVRIFGAKDVSAGGTALVGTYAANKCTVYAFALPVASSNAGAWSQTQKLKPTDCLTSNNDAFGSHLSIASSSNNAAISAEDQFGATGAVYIFSFSMPSSSSFAVWSQVAKLLAPDGSATNTFGYSVSMSAHFLAVGAPKTNFEGTTSGSAYIFTGTGTGGKWSYAARLTPSDANAFFRFGSSISAATMIGPNGDEIQTVVVGALTAVGTGSSQAQGSAYLFALRNVASTSVTGNSNAFAWSQQAKLQAIDKTSYDEFGRCVALSDDGMDLVVGAYATQTAQALKPGRIYYYRAPLALPTTPLVIPPLSTNAMIIFLAFAFAFSFVLSGYFRAARKQRVAEEVEEKRLDQFYGSNEKVIVEDEEQYEAVSSSSPTMNPHMMNGAEAAGGAEKDSHSRKGQDEEEGFFEESFSNSNNSPLGAIASASRGKASIRLPILTGAAASGNSKSGLNAFDPSDAFAHRQSTSNGGSDAYGQTNTAQFAERQHSQDVKSKAAKDAKDDKDEVTSENSNTSAVTGSLLNFPFSYIFADVFLALMAAFTNWCFIYVLNEHGAVPYAVLMGSIYFIMSFIPWTIIMIDLFFPKRLSRSFTTGITTKHLKLEPFGVTFAEAIVVFLALFVSLDIIRYLPWRQSSFSLAARGFSTFRLFQVCAYCGLFLASFQFFMQCVAMFTVKFGIQECVSDTYCLDGLTIVTSGGWVAILNIIFLAAKIIHIVYNFIWPAWSFAAASRLRGGNADMTSSPNHSRPVLSRENNPAISAFGSLPTEEDEMAALRLDEDDEEGAHYASDDDYVVANKLKRDKGKGKGKSVIEDSSSSQNSLKLSAANLSKFTKAQSAQSGSWKLDFLPANYSPSLSTLTRGDANTETPRLSSPPNPTVVAVGREGARLPPVKPPRSNKPSPQARLDVSLSPSPWQQPQQQQQQQQLTGDEVYPMETSRSSQSGDVRSEMERQQDRERDRHQREEARAQKLRDARLLPDAASSALALPPLPTPRLAPSATPSTPIPSAISAAALAAATPAAVVEQIPSPSKKVVVPKLNLSGVEKTSAVDVEFSSTWKQIPNDVGDAVSGLSSSNLSSSSDEASDEEREVVVRRPGFSSKKC